MNDTDLKKKSEDELLELIRILVKKRATATAAEKIEIKDGIALAEALIVDINNAALGQAAEAVAEAAKKLSELMNTVTTAPLSGAFGGAVDALNDLA